MTTSSLVRDLDQLKDNYGSKSTARKLELLKALENTRLESAAQLFQLHETLCFLRAYPDSAAVLKLVERMLDSFSARPDLRRNRKALADTGIAGTTIHFRFFWFAARWLVRKWPGQLHIDWRSFENKNTLTALLHLLVLYPELLAVDEFDYPVRQWIERLKAADETDADFLIRRFDALGSNSFERETLFENLDIPLRLEPAEDTPSRTRAKFHPARVVYQHRPLRRSRPSLKQVLRQPAPGIRRVSPEQGRQLIDLSLEAIVTRSRDLDIFEHGSPDDVWLFDWGDGFQLACIGGSPERRLLLEAVYGLVYLKNGVPIGYLVASGLFASSEIAFNIFDTFRGGESALLFARALAATHHLLGTDTFTIDPFQLGYGNAEALRSGAWWFYYKMGFRPVASENRRIMQRERRRMKANPRYRSNITTLEDLSSESVFFHLGPKRQDVLGKIELGTIGLHISSYIAHRFGADRERASRTCAREAARLLGVNLRGFSAGERLAWQRWSPLVLILPGIERWGPQSRRALAEVVRAKGWREESRFVHRFDRHGLLRKALLNLAADSGD